ncbi:hypothetical protein FKM82_026635 [Ascaphus truei]
MASDDFDIVIEAMLEAPYKNKEKEARPPTVREAPCENKEKEVRFWPCIAPPFQWSPCSLAGQTPRGHYSYAGNV